MTIREEIALYRAELAERREQGEDTSELRDILRGLKEAHTW